MTSRRGVIRDFDRTGTDFSDRGVVKVDEGEEEGEDQILDLQEEEEGVGGTLDLICGTTWRVLGHRKRQDPVGGV